MHRTRTQILRKQIILITLTNNTCRLYFSKILETNFKEKELAKKSSPQKISRFERGRSYPIVIKLSKKKIG